ncbi:hypothetical protein E1A44_16795 [Salmonella enterica subsp. enterica serovar Typhimurium]|nr:hypothetical protein [Salmonella enterica subsp. enterica serovar Typhimurium]
MSNSCGMTMTTSQVGPDRLAAIALGDLNRSAPGTLKTLQWAIFSLARVHVNIKNFLENKNLLPRTGFNKT